MYSPMHPPHSTNANNNLLSQQANRSTSSISSASRAAKSYQSVSTRSAGIEDASPVQLTQLLFDGALARLTTAKGHMQRKEIAKKGEILGKAIALINELQHSLNQEAGGDLAERLDNLYDYMLRQLTIANRDNNPDIIDEVHHLLSQITDAWRQLPQR